MATTTASSVSSDQEKFLAAKLIARAQLRLVCASLCDKIQQPKGSGATAYFIRYNRMNVPVATLTEGTDPTAQAVSVTSYSVALDQWGDVIEITDLAEAETSHPLVQQCVELLAENAQRVIDREVQIVWMAGTNVQYGDGSTQTARTDVTSAMKLTDAAIHKAIVTLVDAGAPPRGGPSGGMAVDAGKADGSINGTSNYVGVAGPHVIRDIMTAGTSLGTFASVSMYANQKALYNAEVGTWLGVRWVETNFIPKFVLLGNSTAAVASAASGGITGFTITAATSGGALLDSTTYYWKVTRKDLTRGFEEAISIEHTTATGAAATADDNSFVFAMPSTAGYVYNIYFGSSTGDSNLKLVSTGNHAASASVTVTAVSSSTTTAPSAIRTDGTNPTTIHPVYVLGAEACSWVGLQNLQTFMTKDESIMGNVLRLKRAFGYKFMAKAMIRDQNRILRIEVASTFG